MKNHLNILICKPRPEAEDRNDKNTLVDQLAEALMEFAWVYVAELGRRGIEDSEAGVRYMRWDESAVDRFGKLDAVIVVDDRKAADAIRTRRTDVSVIFWQRHDPESGDTSNPPQLEIFRRTSPLFPLIENLVAIPPAA